MEGDMTAVAWEDLEWSGPVAFTRPRLRLVTAAEAALPDLGPAPQPAPRRPGGPEWELTRRGMAWALTGLGTLFATGAATLVWGFLQIPVG
jgi:hypothetical protein